MMGSRGELGYEGAMRHDVWQLDRELSRMRDERRRALDRAALSVAEAAGDRAAPSDPFRSELFRLHEELAEADDPVARAIASWLDVMVIERAVWEDRLRVEAAWELPHRVSGLEAEVSMRALRRQILREPNRERRGALSRGFASACQGVSDRAVPPLVWRLEREREAYLRVDGEPVEGELLAVRGARGLLDATRDLVEGVAPGLFEHACAALGGDANEGWPARLTTRWLGDVFKGTGLGKGLDVALGRPPEAWGASSFARALGALGAAVLEAARPRSVPFALHKRPRGHRQHARRALFAAVVAERPFATRVLGLGADRVRDHRRRTARALCLSLRFDALRVLAAEALLSGEAAGKERFSDLTERHVGAASEPALLGVVPRLRPIDGPALVGGIWAVEDRAALVDRHDEDWFRNPRAIETLRHEDEGLPPPPPTAEQLDAALARLVASLEEALG